MTDTVDRLVRMLDEEREATKLAIQQRWEADRAHMHTRGELKRTERDREAAEAKIDEWFDYAAKLAEMLKQRKVLTEKLPPAPEPYAREMPF